jgi:hypothetical protein
VNLFIHCLEKYKLVVMNLGRRKVKESGRVIRMRVVMSKERRN